MFVFSSGTPISDTSMYDICAYFFYCRLILRFLGSSLLNGTVSANKSKFDDKIEASSAKMYFHYYGQLLHQQNMLQDYVRTGKISCLSVLVVSELVQFS